MMRMAFDNRSSYVALTAAAVVALSATPGYYQNYSLPSLSFQKGIVKEETETPAIITTLNQQMNWKEEALRLFPELRDFNQEESDFYEASLDKMFTPTGKNFFDLC